MNYRETCDYLFNQMPSFEKQGSTGFKEGLANTLALDEHFGHPHRHFRTIHVAGTNGKGSVSHTLAAILQSAGYRVGLYTSPHLADFRERIRVNGTPVSEDYVVDFVAGERSFFEPLAPSFFELTTAMAFKYFHEQRVDIAVIEVGLGGRLDCTNIITPLLSVITNISFDHTQMLGNTLALIAGEKAGIIKQGIPVVIGETTAETRPVFEDKAQAMKAPILFAEETPMPTPQQQQAFALKGDYQIHNLRTILCAANEMARIIDIPHPDEAIARGLADVCRLTGLHGRWETLRQQPLVICDTGHNLAGWQYLAPQIMAQPCRQRRIVFGMVDDKDVDHVMALLPKDATYYYTKGNTHRAVSEQVLLEKGRQNGLHGEAFPTVQEAYRKAIADARPDDFIFVGGSNYVVAELFVLQI